MASYARCSFFFLLILSIFLQIHAREIKHFSKVTKPTKKNHESISVSPVPSPSPAPALSPAESEAVVEHGYGLYGRDPYENIPENTVKGTEKPVFEEEKYVPVAELSQENNGERFENGFPKDNFVGDEYQYTPTVENPTKTNVVGEEKYVHTNEFNNNNNNNNNEYVSEKQGMSDTRFLENGKYYYDVNQEGNKDVSNYVRNEGNNEGYVPQKQGMSDTKFLENGKYFYDIQNEEGVNKGDNDALFDANNNNENNEQFQEERHGMSDTHYLNNGKYFYDVNNENEKNNNLYNNNMNNNNNNNNNNFLYNNNNNNNNGYVNENEGYYNFEGNAKKYPNEYVTQGKKGNFGSPKKFPNEYDTMEEYDREQGYVDPQAVYVP